MKNTFCVRYAVVALSALSLFGAAHVARAETTYNYSYNFDDVAAGTLVSSLFPANLSINPAIYDYIYNDLGDAIPGTLRWRIDATVPAVPVVAGDDTFPAPTPPNLMGDRLSPILINLGPGLTYVNSVSFTLDNDPFGDTEAAALFLGLSGTTVTSRVTDQTVPGTTYTITAPNKSATGILLPAGASYDNLFISAIAAPEPGTLPLSFGALLLTGGIALVRRRS